MCFSKDTFYDDIIEIQYRYLASSVPPPLHRSYTITINKKNIHVIVNSYSKILAEKDYPISPEDFTKLVQSAKDNRIQKAKIPRKGREGCTGGTAKYITFTKKNNKHISAFNYYCGGEVEGDLEGEITDFVNEIKKMIPDFKTLRNTPYPKE